MLFKEKNVLNGKVQHDQGVETQDFINSAQTNSQIQCNPNKILDRYEYKKIQEKNPYTDIITWFMAKVLPVW